MSTFTMSFVCLLFQNALMMLSVGDEKGAGLFLVAGPEDIVAAVGPR